MPLNLIGIPSIPVALPPLRFFKGKITLFLEISIFNISPFFELIGKSYEHSPNFSLMSLI